MVFLDFLIYFSFCRTIIVFTMFYGFGTEFWNGYLTSSELSAHFYDKFYFLVHVNISEYVCDDIEW